MYLKQVIYSYPIDKLIHILPKWVKASYYFGGACDTSQKKFYLLTPKKHLPFKSGATPTLYPTYIRNTHARNSIFSIFDPFFIFRLPDKSFVEDWIDDVVDEYRVQLDLELAFCILLYSSHSLL